MKKIVITFAILNVLALLTLFLLYGPFSILRDPIITTSMSTMNHRYIARVFYDDETIYKVLSKNKLEEGTDDSNSSDINFENATKEPNQYEKEILNHNQGDLYKVVKINESNYKGFLVAVYDPSKISLQMTAHLGSSGQFLKTIIRNNNGLIGINASGFSNAPGIVTGGDPTGQIIKDGRLIWSGSGTGWGGGLIGFNKDNVLVLTRDTAEEAIKKGMRDAVEFGPFLIVNGKSATITGDGGYGLAPRTAIGQRKDGIVLFLVIDGRQPGYSLGADMGDLIKIFERYGAWNASNLDGGASSAIVENGEYLNKQNYDRAAPNAWVVK